MNIGAITAGATAAARHSRSRWSKKLLNKRVDKKTQLKQIIIGLSLLLIITTIILFISLNL